VPPVGHWEDAWLQLAWDTQWEGKSIAAKELVPIVLACAVWGPVWKDKQVLVKCDNMSVVQVVAALTSRDPLLMHLLRLLYFFRPVYSIHLRVEHIPGVHNTLADTVSRNLLQVLHQLRPSVCRSLTPIPGELLQVLGSNHQVWLSPDWRKLLKTSSLRV
jgi:hypothetical protein